MRTNNLRKLSGAFVAPALLLLCVTALSPSTAVRAQARQEIDRNDESTRSEPARSSDSSSSSNSSSTSSSTSSNDTSSSNSSSNSSSSNSSIDTGSSSSSDSSSRRSGGDEGKRGGGRGGDGYDKGRRNDNNDRRLDASRKSDDKRRDNKDSYDPLRDDNLYNNSAAQSANDQDECERGLAEGRRTGASDARRGQTKDPYRSRHYRRGGGGFFSWGRSDTAKQSYRDCFLRGYEEGYQNPNLY